MVVERTPGGVASAFFRNLGLALAQIHWYGEVEVRPIPKETQISMVNRWDEATAPTWYHDFALRQGTTSSWELFRRSKVG